MQDRTEYAAQLRALRTAAGLRQVDVCERLGGSIARSTLANLETGRESPSTRVRGLIADAFPEWRAALDAAYASDRASTAPAPGGALDVEPAAGSQLLGGPFVVESLILSYLFHDSRSPSEIIEARRVRARRNGADSYGLKMMHTESAAFSATSEPLWGGHLETTEHVHGAGRTVFVRRFVFDRRLRRGQSHDFALRTRIDTDPEPGTAVAFDLTIPAEQVTVQLGFRGSERPRGWSAFGPLVDNAQVPEHPGDAPRSSLPASGQVSAYFRNPELGTVYGIAWEW
ncbi:helix-turn-helix domain-containing protein [Nocardioides ferulae]|uniref:helix-turn-helix domain-containing protein n=1 Tax=Nocardioides ferulae TaxID=2340821 RepID=UPI000EAEA9A7|nr:helix-turn-helix transcriptional regulator [Nocardioides ferulae]